MKYLMMTAAILSLGLVACNEEKQADSAVPRVEKLAGKWNGPEGTYLDIKPAGDAYELTIANLDGPRTFKGEAYKDGIQFDRDGVAEKIVAGDGAATGMKWLADKKNCLVVKAGEGYCRD